jgi:hypothetical protein
VEKRKRGIINQRLGFYNFPRLSFKSLGTRSLLPVPTEAEKGPMHDTVLCGPGKMLPCYSKPFGSLNVIAHRALSFPSVSLQRQNIELEFADDVCLTLRCSFKESGNLIPLQLMDISTYKCL